jgi:diguanylate cyclase (GGDEF)-like protein
MSLDIPTLATAATCITGLLGVFLLVVWIQERTVKAMAWWACAYMVGAIAVALWGIQKHFISSLTELPNALLFIACGMIWNGARVFHGRRALPGTLISGALLWLLACQTPAFAEPGHNRIILSCAIIAVYTFLTSMELRRERRRALRWIAVGAPLLHGAVFLTPIAVILLLPGGASTDGWFAVFALQTLLYVVGTAFVVVVMANERTTAQYKTAAMTDPLTGLFNRRAFFAAANSMIAAQMRKKKPVSVLAFDLDKFKSINDRYGHAIGDETLRLFAATASANMRQSDVIGRLGGEEFVAILPGNAQEALLVAERVRAAFEAAGVEIGGHKIGATVSIGVAEAGPPLAEFGEILQRADAALYRAKEGGRNRVVIDGDAPATLAAAPHSAAPHSAAA